LPDLVLCRILDNYGIPYDETITTSSHGNAGQQPHTVFAVNELRIWILRYDDPVTVAATSRKRRGSDEDPEGETTPSTSSKVDRSYLFTTPYYQSRAVPSVTHPKMHWELMLTPE
jgi:hypothetical protein